jgi:hypothetical protein
MELIVIIAIVAGIAFLAYRQFTPKKAAEEVVTPEPTPAPAPAAKTTKAKAPAAKKTTTRKPRTPK